MISSGNLAAILACSPEGARGVAASLLAVACAAAAIPFTPSKSPPGVPRGHLVMRAFGAIDDLEDLATRLARGSPTLAARRATIALRAIVARGRPVIHDRGPFLADDETGESPRWILVGPRGAANDTAALERRAK